MKDVKIGLLVVFLSTIFLSNCASVRQMRKDRTEGDINNLEDKVAENIYTVKVLYRRYRDPIHHKEVDAVLFNTNGGKFKYIRRIDDDHRLILDSVEGEEGQRVTKENIKRFEEIIRKNRLKPYVLLDKEGREIAIVYADMRSVIHYGVRKDGRIFLAIRSISKFFRKKDLIFRRPQRKDDC